MEEKTLWEGDTAHGHYEVLDTMYDGRSARVLYSGDRLAAQSGIAKDENTDLLFDYNQRLFEIAASCRPKRILVVGGGAFTLPGVLLRALPEAPIDVVELDEALIDIAHRFFGLPIDGRLNIFTTDGRTFLREHVQRYDMIVVDAYVNSTIPKELKTLEAFRAYRAHLQVNGVLAVNVISGYHGTKARILEQMYAAAAQTFDHVDIFYASRGYSLWLPQNFVLTCQRGRPIPLADYVRYGTVTPPETSPAMALLDD